MFKSIEALPVLKTIFFLVFAFQNSFAARGAEYQPVAVWSETICTSEETSVGKMIDGNPATFADLLDDTLTGKSEKTVPAHGAQPVTGSFVLDLGSVRSICGLRFVSAPNWIIALPEKVSVFACSDAQGTQDLRPLVEQANLPGLYSGLSSFVSWNNTDVRYLKVQIIDSYGKNYNYWWSGGIWKEILAKTPYPFYGDGSRFETRIAEVVCFDAIPDDFLMVNAPEVACPQWRVERDWMYQDHGFDLTDCFRGATDAIVERTMVEKAIADVKREIRNEKSEAVSRQLEQFRQDVSRLTENKIPGNDPRWKTLYLNVCQFRRLERLAALRERSEQYIYVKRFLGGNQQSENEVDFDVTDEQFWDLKPIVSGGAQLCRLTINASGTLKNEILLEQNDGLICDPDVSSDGKTVVFAMRKNFVRDNLYLYTMNLETKEVKQITFPLQADGLVYPNGHRYPVFTPEGKILFAATRCVQINDCWPRQNWDIYSCNPDGTNIVRLTFDQLKTDSPRILPDGKVIFCRWEYNDRNAYYPHLLMTMNPDGTAQMEYYGGGSVYPCNILSPCGVPGTTKVLAVISGHHTHSRGKLALFDRNQGTQDGRGIEFVAGASTLERPPHMSNYLEPLPGRQKSFVFQSQGLYTHWDWDFFGQTGPQYMSPYAFDETNYLCAYHPEGWLKLKSPYEPPFGSYYMTADGARELLAFDWRNPCIQMVPVTSVFKAPVVAPSSDLNDSFGTFYIQNIYLGPGLKGVEPGTVKRLRVCAMAYRHARMGNGNNAGEAGQGPSQTAVSLLNGSWDVKHVLGEVDVEPDGSCCFRVPARQPVFFQLLDANGYCVQTMRSWSTLQGGERLACLGCHENKNDALKTSQKQLTDAMRKPIQTPRPIAGREHPLMERLKTQTALDSAANYLGVNAAISVEPNDPVEGFSYIQEIQPIWNRHCTRCHRGNVNDPDPLKRSKLSLTSELIDPSGKVRKTYNYNYKKSFAQSYCALTCFGEEKDNPYLNWLNARARTEMIPPYFYGSSKSPIMGYLESSHYNVHLSDGEKRTVACWIDLNVPYCGSHAQSNTWTDEEKKEYQYFIDKREAFAREEIETIKSDGDASSPNSGG